MGNYNYKSLNMLIALRSQNAKISGYTLIEILIVFSVIAILTSLTLASFYTFTTMQSNTSGINDFIALLQTAKSNALSQVKPTPQCDNQTLNGYQVMITLPDKYELDAVCNNTAQRISNIMQLPSQVTFDNNSSQLVLFNILNGTVSSPATFTLLVNGKDHTVTVNSSGTISGQ